MAYFSSLLPRRLYTSSTSRVQAGASVQDDLRQLMRRTAQPVAVALVRLQCGSMHGATLSSLSSVSLNPPLVAFSIRLPSTLANHLIRVDCPPLQLYLLSDSQSNVARYYSGQQQAVSTSEDPVDLLKEGMLGLLQCTLMQSLDLSALLATSGGSKDPSASNSRLFLARAIHIEFGKETSTRFPLLWHNQQYCTIK